MPESERSGTRWAKALRTVGCRKPAVGVAAGGRRAVGWASAHLFPSTSKPNSRRNPVAGGCSLFAANGFDSRSDLLIVLRDSARETRRGTMWAEAHPTHYPISETGSKRTGPEARSPNRESIGAPLVVFRAPDARNSVDFHQNQAPGGTFGVQKAALSTDNGEKWLTSPCQPCARPATPGTNVLSGGGIYPEAGPRRRGGCNASMPGLMPTGLEVSNKATFTHRGAGGNSREVAKPMSNGKNGKTPGGPRPPGRGRLRRLTPCEKIEAIRMYADGDHVVDIQSRFRCDARRIYEALPPDMPRRRPRRR